MNCSVTVPYGIVDMRTRYYSYPIFRKIIPKIFLFHEKLTPKFFDEIDKGKTTVTCLTKVNINITYLLGKYLRKYHDIFE